MLYSSEMLCKKHIFPYLKNFPYPWLVSFAGFPATGKSTLTQFLKKLVGIKDTVIINESAYMLFSRNERLKKHLSGCALSALDLEKYSRDIDQIKNGKDTTLVQAYSYQSGKLFEIKQSINIKNFRCLILDGPRSCHPAVVNGFQVVLFLFPREMDKWHEFSIARDKKERRYKHDQAVINTSLCENDMKHIYLRSKSVITHEVFSSIVMKNQKY